MNNKVQNQKTMVPANSEMNDRDFLNDMLETEKNMSVNFTYALNEASNETLFNEIYEMFKQIKASQRNLFELSFRKGFYKKQEIFDNYVRKTFGESHVGPTTFILYNGGTIEEPRFVINKNGKPFFKLEELCDKNGLVHTNFSTYPTGTLPEIHKYDLFGHFK